MCLIRVVQCSNPMFPTQGEPSCLSPLTPLPRSLQVSTRRVWGRRGSRCQDCSEFSLKGPLKSGSHFVSAILCQRQSAIFPTLSRTGVGIGGRVGTNSHTPPPICPPPRVWGWLGEGGGGGHLTRRPNSPHFTPSLQKDNSTPLQVWASFCGTSLGVACVTLDR